jgi:hypothetical protein
VASPYAGGAVASKGAAGGLGATGGSAGELGWAEGSAAVAFSNEGGEGGSLGGGEEGVLSEFSVMGVRVRNRA